MKRRRAVRWLSWLLGLAALATVVVLALHFAEERELVRLALDAQPWWLLVAFVIQAFTYWAQGETWRVVTRAAHLPLTWRTAFRLSIAKLFVDQALPSGGISGTVVIERAFEQQAVPRPVAMATIVIATVAYYLAYIVTLAVALTITIIEGHANVLVLLAALLFCAFGVVVAAALLELAGHARRPHGWVLRIPGLGTGLSLLGVADPGLSHDQRLIGQSTLYQIALVLLDAATMWVLVRAVGQHGSISGVFASFMLSSLWRTLGIFPAGLGTFEAASVLTLTSAGVSVAAALAATLLFRGLTFWLPMIPGFAIARAIRTATSAAPPT